MLRSLAGLNVWDSIKFVNLKHAIHDETHVYIRLSGPRTVCTRYCRYIDKIHKCCCNSSWRHIQMYWSNIRQYLHHSVFQSVQVCHMTNILSRCCTFSDHSDTSCYSWFPTCQTDTLTTRNYTVSEGEIKAVEIRTARSDAGAVLFLWTKVTK